MTPQQEIFPAVPEDTPQPIAQPEAATAEPEAGPAASLLTLAIDETTKREQQHIQSAEDKLKWQQRLARLFCEAGTFEGWEEKKLALTPQQRLAQAMVKIMLGESCGLTPIEAMQSIYLVKGRPALDAQIRAARMKRHGYYWSFAQLNDKGCILIPCHKDNAPVKLPNGGVIHPFADAQGEPERVSFCEFDATRAGLLPAKEMSGWKTYPTDMYYARAITRMQRRYASEVLNGATILDRAEVEDIQEAAGPRRPLIRKSDDVKETAA